jgi:hypothetical protein
MNKFSHTSAGLKSLCYELCVNIHGNFHRAATIFGPRWDKPIYEDFSFHFEPTIKVKTLEVAIHHRSLDDLLGDCQSRTAIEAWNAEEPCGKLLGSNGSVLSLRECSNKVIHADSFEYQYSSYQTKDFETNQTYVNSVEESELILVGRRGKKDWKVALDILLYAEHVYQYAHHAEQEFGI